MVLWFFHIFLAFFRCARRNIKRPVRAVICMRRAWPLSVANVTKPRLRVNAGLPGHNVYALTTEATCRIELGKWVLVRYGL